jgi:hypothetical protein
MPGQPARRQDARSLVRSTQRPPAHHSNGPAGTEHLRTELSLELHETPDHGAVRADVLLDFGSRLGDGCQLDAEQLRTRSRTATSIPGWARRRPPPRPHPHTFSAGHAREPGRDRLSTMERKMPSASITLPCTPPQISGQLAVNRSPSSANALGSVLPAPECCAATRIRLVARSKPIACFSRATSAWSRPGAKHASSRSTHAACRCRVGPAAVPHLRLCPPRVAIDGRADKAGPTPIS